MTNYERGRRYEYKSIRLLETQGFECTRAAGSHGVADIIGFSAATIMLCQVKVDCNPTPAEREQFELFPVPTNCVKLFHLWRKGARAPIVKVI